MTAPVPAPDRDRKTVPICPACEPHGDGSFTCDPQRERCPRHQARRPHRARLAGCAYGLRHWFAYYGQVGTSASTCRRCGAPNPNYRPDDDPQAAR